MDTAAFLLAALMAGGTGSHADSAASAVAASAASSCTACATPSWAADLAVSPMSEISDLLCAPMQVAEWIGRYITPAADTMLTEIITGLLASRPRTLPRDLPVALCRTASRVRMLIDAVLNSERPGSLRDPGGRENVRSRTVHSSDDASLPKEYVDVIHLAYAGVTAFSRISGLKENILALSPLPRAFSVFSQSHDSTFEPGPKGSMTILQLEAALAQTPVVKALCDTLYSSSAGGSSSVYGGAAASRLQAADLRAPLDVPGDSRAACIRLISELPATFADFLEEKGAITDEGAPTGTPAVLTAADKDAHKLTRGAFNSLVVFNVLRK